ncbi:MAG: peptidoglycan bridge formation glycyltransferase FemA/FemB family protein [Patescibacteria group bacterium]
MAKYTSKIIEDKKVWEKFMLSQKPQSFLQSWNWGETNKLTGNQVIRTGFFSGPKLVGCAQIIVERAKRGSYFLVPGGPLLDWENTTLVKFFLDEIKNLALKENVWFIRIRPEVLDSQNSQKEFSNLGFVKAPMHLHAQNTWVLDITPSEEDLLAGMRKTTRYLIRQSEKHELTVELSKDPKMADILYKLQAETVARHKFIPFPKKLFASQIETFEKDNEAEVFICKKGNDILAAAIIIFYGDYAYYHHSGSVSLHRDIPFSYFLQWEIIKEAKRRAKKAYNFWGIAPTDNPKHRFAGVTIFKKGFGGKRVDWLPAHDLPISPKYWLTYAFETIRKIRRGL